MDPCFRKLSLEGTVGEGRKGKGETKGLEPPRGPVQASERRAEKALCAAGVSQQAPCTGLGCACLAHVPLSSWDCRSLEHLGRLGCSQKAAVRGAVLLTQGTSY